MSYVVGPKGQVVISKEIRDKLGVKRGWLALQRVVDDHVEIYFLPPGHRNSLKGSLADYIDIGAVQGLSWSEIKEKAWAAAAMEFQSRDTSAADGLS